MLTATSRVGAADSSRPRRATDITRPGRRSRMTQTAPRAAGSRVGVAAAIVGLSGVAVNGLAYAVPLLGARLLSPADLGALAAALALGSIGSVAGLGLQTAVAVHRARHGSVHAGRVTIATAAVVAGAMVATAALVAAALHLSL